MSKNVGKYQLKTGSVNAYLCQPFISKLRIPRLEHNLKNKQGRFRTKALLLVLYVTLVTQ